MSKIPDNSLVFFVVLYECLFTQVVILLLYKISNNCVNFFLYCMKLQTIVISL